MRRASRLATPAVLALVLAACGGGSDSGSPPPPTPSAVVTGFTGDLAWEAAGGGAGGVGTGADGAGGFAAGGKFYGATVEVWREDGTLLGSALSDATTGLVTVKPSAGYAGTLLVVVKGSATAKLYDEGLDADAPFPAGRTLRAFVPVVARNVGVTAFTEAAYQLLTAGSTPERVDGKPTAAQVRAANERIRAIVNAYLPETLQLDDLTRLPAQRGQKDPGGKLTLDAAGRYALVEGALGKQAQRSNGERTSPALDAAAQLAEDLKDGVLDGRNGALPAAPTAERAYDPSTFGGELVSAVAQQAERFGKAEVMAQLPRVVSFGNTRYLGYLFDGSVTREGAAYSTVAGWVAGNALGKEPGGADQKLAFVPRTAGILANMGHGGGFFKADAAGAKPKVYALGDNLNGELGLGNRTSTAGTTVELTSLPATLTHAAGGYAHTVARLSDGSVWSWGDNGFGQLGLGLSKAALRRALTPQRVTLPRGALSVAATTTASYALLDDGTVWAWGSNAGFGLLGDGRASGIVTAPAQVPGLSGVVQLAARDLDAVVLKGDGTVWQWGSFPADDPAFVPGDPAAPYAGGHLAPTQVAGLPAGLAVREILTEQAVFAALLENGHVYTWGVHFDLTAGRILRDLAAVRVLGLPPIRDLLPGGYNGYGPRAFDRQTALGVDYAGGYWKVRGRVAEAFDPADPATQHRPLGQGPRVDCVACHTFLDAPLVDLVAAAPSTAGLPLCVSPPSVHAGPLGSLIRAETVCVSCHNPARLDYPVVTPSGKLPFEASGGWPNCLTPSDLPARGFVDPPLISNACAIPPGHRFTPPGTVCATCHASVIATPLDLLAPPCAQPDPSALPTLETVATVDGATDGAALPIPAGGLTATRAPLVHGTLSAPLETGEVLSVARNGAAVGDATAAGTGWTFQDAAVPDGAAAYTARVVSGADFGATSAPFSFTIDATPPSAVVSIASFVDDVLGAIPPDGFATDTTPGVSGALSGAIGPGELVQVLRDGIVVGTGAVAGAGFTYAEPAALGLATYTYAARVVDPAGNLGATSAGAKLTLVGPLPAAAIAQVTGGGQPVANGAATTATSLQLSGTLSAGLQAGWSLRVRRNGSDAGAAAVTGTSWTFSQAGLADGTWSYTARVEAGAVLGALSAAYAVTVDTAPPAQTANATLVSDDFNGALADGATTADPTPLVSGTLTAALAAGEQVRVLRGGAAVGFATASGTTWSYPEPAALANGSYTYQARVVDAAGQQGPLGASRSVTVDTSSVPLIGAATTLATVNGVAPAGGAVALNNDRTPTLAGALQRALNANEVVRVYRDGVAVGNGTAAGTSWSFTSASLADGTYAFRARVELSGNAAVFGVSSATVSDPIDGTAPAQAAAIAAVYDDSGALVDVTNRFSTDTTPRVDGTLSAPLAAGDFVRLTRDGVEVAKLRPAGTTWSYVEPAAVALGTRTYAADVRDDAGNTGTAAASSATVKLIAQASLPNATLANATVSGAGSPGKPNGTSVASGGAIPDATPTLTITLPSALPAGYQVTVLRDGTAIGTPLAACASPCTFTDPGATEGSHTYTARTNADAVLGTLSGPYVLTIDTVAPVQTVTVNQVRSDVAPSTTLAGAVPANNLIAAGGNTNDTSPTFRFTLSPALGSGEAVSIRRGATVLAPTLTGCGANCWEFDAPTGVVLWTNMFDASGLPLYAPSSPPLQSATNVTFTLRVVDLAGNESPVATRSMNVGYFRCDQVRANTAYALHPNSVLSASANPGGTCTGCHVTGPNHPAGGTPSGFFVAVPSAAPTYWCGRPP